MRLIGTVAGACVAATVLTGCGGGGSQQSSGPSGGGGKVVDGGTFTLALKSDPGNLDPQGSAASDLYQTSHFAYDTLVNLDAKGAVISGMASSWSVDGQKVTLTLKDGITCSDGSAFTAADAAANLSYVSDPASKSPFLGVYVPVGAKATASGSELTMALSAPAPFALEGLAGVPMVCKSGMADRSVLARETRGTGPYQLKEVAAGDRYTFTKRDGYTWGPGGASTATAGMPAQVVLKVVANETTAANLLLSGGLSAATIVGPDASRLKQSGLFFTAQKTLLGEMWFNHDAGRPGADPAVRKALTQALDLTQVAKVLQADPPTGYAIAPPIACPGTNVASSLPQHDLAAAGQTLEAAGWTAGAGGIRAKAGKPLAMTLLYGAGLGVNGSAAAELAASQWKQLGAQVTLKQQDETAATQTVFGSGDWDITWLQLNVSSPDQLVPFMSGPAPADGNNFAHIDNPTYDAAVAKAASMPGTSGCGQWAAAEQSLAAAADVVPFANRTLPTFGTKARFETGGVAVVATSIRMLAE